MYPEVDFMDLIHWDVGFALKKMKEQVDKGQYKRLVVSADRQLFPISGLRGYLERTSISNLARVRDIYKKARTVVDLHNAEFKALENEISYDVTHSFVLPNGGFLQINCPIECIEIRDKNIFNTIPAKANYDHFFEEHPGFSLYSSQEFANSCSIILNVLSAFYPEVVSATTDKMTAEEKFLCLLYLKTKNDPQKGFNPVVIAKLVGVPAKEMSLLQYQLSQGEYVHTNQGFGNNLVISGKGIQLARSLLAGGRVMVIKFLSANYVSPTEVAKHSVAYYYHVIIPDHKEANYSITVSATDVVAGTWDMPFASGQPGEQLLLLHGKDYITQKLLQGELQQHEALEIRMRDLHNLPNYTIDDFVPVREAEFLVEQLRQTAAAPEHTADTLGGWIVKTRNIINTLFKSVYKEDLFLQPDLQNAIDLHKEATTEEAFYARVASLATTVGDMNLAILRELTNKTDKQVRTISLLSTFVQTLTQDPAPIIRPMRNIIDIRNAYPMHRDKKETFDAYRELGITPPVMHYSDAWKVLLTAYWKALEGLKELFIKKLDEQTPRSA